MTLVCPSSGPSRIKTGTLGTLIYASGGAAILSEFGVPWLVTAAAALGIISFETTTLCASDPPAMPTWTDADTFALYTADPGPAGHTARDKITQLLGNLVWYQACECITGPQPTPPAPPADPGGTSIVSTGAPQPVTPCVTFVSAGGATLGAGVGLHLGGPSFIGRNATWVLVSWTSTLVGPSPAFQIRLNQEITGPPVVLVDTTAHVVNAPSGSVLLPILATVDFIDFQAGFVVAGTTISNFQLRADIYCDGQLPTDVQQPCCPPGPGTQATLDAILTIVTLMQRQIAPFGYVPGTVHAGLSGNGQFSVQGILGLAVDLTTTPGRAGLEVGDPNQLFEVGWINVGTADGWGPRQFITSDPFIYRPVAGDVTLVGYSIPADVVVTITELVREP